VVEDARITHALLSSPKSCTHSYGGSRVDEDDLVPDEELDAVDVGRDLGLDLRVDLRAAEDELVRGRARDVNREAARRSASCAWRTCAAKRSDASDRGRSTS
jgi:hypothetical protein